jgi:hypothetical protein
MIVKLLVTFKTRGKTMHTHAKYLLIMLTLVIIIPSFYCRYATYLTVIYHHHHQPINVPTAGAQAFLMDYTQGERAIAHHKDPVRIGRC